MFYKGIKEKVVTTDTRINNAQTHCDEPIGSPHTHTQTYKRKQCITHTREAETHTHRSIYKRKQLSVSLAAIAPIVPMDESVNYSWALSRNRSKTMGKQNKTNLPNDPGPEPCENTGKTKNKLKKLISHTDGTDVGVNLFLVKPHHRCEHVSFCCGCT